MLCRMSFTSVSQKDVLEEIEFFGEQLDLLLQLLVLGLELGHLVGRFLGLFPGLLAGPFHCLVVSRSLGLKR